MLTAAQLRAKLIERYPFSYANAQILDGTFEPVPLADLAEFSEELKACLAEAMPDGWEAFSDCDNFALHAQMLACDAHYESRRENLGKAEGVAFGQISYQRDDGRPHRINIFFGDDGEFHEYEPQTQREVKLSAMERDNVSSPYFT